MIPVEKPAALPKANALDPRRDSVAEPELLNPAPVAQGEEEPTKPAFCASPWFSDGNLQCVCGVTRRVYAAQLAECDSCGRRWSFVEGVDEWERQKTVFSLKAEAERLKHEAECVSEFREEESRVLIKARDERDALKAEVERLKREADWRGELITKALEKAGYAHTDDLGAIISVCVALHKAVSQAADVSRELISERDSLRQMVQQLEAKLVEAKQQSMWREGLLDDAQRATDAEHRLRRILDFVELVGKR